MAKLGSVDGDENSSCQKYKHITPTKTARLKDELTNVASPGISGAFGSMNVNECML